MRDTSQILFFIGGMGASLAMLGFLILMGPSVIPAQFDQCQVELRKAQPNCSTRNRNNLTYVRDSRCVQPGKGMMLLDRDGSGWWQVARIPESTPPTIENAEPNE